MSSDGPGDEAHISSAVYATALQLEEKLSLSYLPSMSLITILGAQYAAFCVLAKLVLKIVQVPSP